MKDHRVNKLAKVRAEIAHLKEVEAEYVRALKESVKSCRASSSRQTRMSRIVCA